MPFDLGIPDFDLGTVSLGLFMETTFFFLPDLYALFLWASIFKV